MLPLGIFIVKIFIQDYSLKWEHFFFNENKSFHWTTNDYNTLEKTGTRSKQTTTNKDYKQATTTSTKEQKVNKANQSKHTKPYQTRDSAKNKALKQNTPNSYKQQTQLNTANKTHYNNECRFQLYTRDKLLLRFLKCPLDKSLARTSHLIQARIASSVRGVLLCRRSFLCLHWL